jgi:Glutamine cyclotransferase
MSDGSSKLRFLDPETFAELGRLEVFDGNKPVEYLNELEFVEGEIYANVQLQDRIAIIRSGHRLDRSGGSEIAHAAAVPRPSASRVEWHRLRRYGPQAVCDRQALAKSL